VEFLGIEWNTQNITILLGAFVMFTPFLLHRLKREDIKIEQRQRAIELLKNFDANDDVASKIIKQSLLRDISGYNAELSFFEDLKKFKHPDFALAQYKRYSMFFTEFPKVLKPKKGQTIFTLFGIGFFVTLAVFFSGLLSSIIYTTLSIDNTLVAYYKAVEQLDLVEDNKGNTLKNFQYNSQKNELTLSLNAIAEKKPKCPIIENNNGCKKKLGTMARAFYQLFFVFTVGAFLLFFISMFAIFDLVLRYWSVDWKRVDSAFELAQEESKGDEEPEDGVVTKKTDVAENKEAAVSTSPSPKSEELFLKKAINHIVNRVIRHFAALLS
jgi:hypothetical protein